MKKNKREEDEEIRRAKANIRTGFIIAVIALTDCAVAFCETVKAAGFEPGVYIYNDTGYYGYDLTRLRDYKSWCVGIGSYPYFYYYHDMWQYSFTGRVPGINADCDLNMLFEK